MRLINTVRLVLEEFRDSDTPPYAILSHRWQKDEVQFEHIGTPAAKERHGYEKLACFCNIAHQHGYLYAWVDTCCIDKTKSTEESEAINSMFR